MDKKNVGIEHLVMQFSI